LDVTPAAVIGTPTAACPSVVTLGFDMGAANTAIGGPTPGANICYSPVTIPPGTACATAGDFATGGITCYTPTGANPTTPVSVSVSGSSIYTLACKANFTSTSVTFPVPTAIAYAEPTITVDGVLNATEWSGTPGLGDQFPTAAGAGTTGGFTFGKTTATGDTLFFSQSGFTAAAGVVEYLYLTDTATATGGTTTTQRVAGGGNLPGGLHAQYAIKIDAAAACGGANPACAITTYTNAGAGWTAQAMPFAVNAAVTLHALEASALITALPGAETTGDAFDIAGEVYNGAALSGGWSKTVGGGESFVENYSSLLCSTPLSALH
jgi:hypothetical protein